MKLSRREKILLVVLVFFAASYLFYTYLLTPQLQKLSDTKLKLEDQRIKQDYASLQMSPSHKIYKDYKILNAQIDMMTKSLLPTIIQEKIVIFIQDMINTSGIKASSISFTEPSLGKPGDEVSSEKSEMDPVIREILEEISGESIYDRVKENEQKEDKKVDSAVDYNLEHMLVTLSLEGSYNQIVKFIEEIEYFNKKILIKSLNLTADQEGKLTGSISLDFYAVPKLNNQDDDYFKWELEDEYGKDNPFEAYKGYENKSGSTGAGAAAGKDTTAVEEKKVYDFIANVRPITSDLPAIIIGDAKEKSSKSYVYADSVNYVDVEFNVFSKDGKYYYRYKTKDSSYPKDYDNGLLEFKPYDEFISFLIDSFKRNGDSDVNGMNITIINNTDLPLNVYVRNDDASRPRVNISKVQGNVKVNK